VRRSRRTFNQNLRNELFDWFAAGIKMADTCGLLRLGAALVLAADMSDGVRPSPGAATAIRSTRQENS